MTTSQGEVLAVVDLVRSRRTEALDHMRQGAADAGSLSNLLGDCRALARHIELSGRYTLRLRRLLATLRRASNATLLAGSFEGRFVAPSAGAQVLEVLLSWLVDEPRPLPRPGAFHEQLLSNWQSEQDFLV